jgi:DNA-binding LacI/PurR family transcriptional regulator
MSRSATSSPVMGDVARLAGVSHQTVLRVVNDQTHISPATRTKVQRAIEDLGYRPNAAARALVRGRTGMAGVVTVSVAFSGPHLARQGVAAAARAAGLSPRSTSSTSRPRHSPQHSETWKDSASRAWWSWPVTTPQ